MVINQSVQPSWWLRNSGLAILVYCLGYFAGALTGETLLYVGGMLVGLAIVAPIWLKRPHYLLIALTIYLPLEDAILQAFSRHTVVERVVPDVLLLIAFCIRIPLARLRRERIFGTPLDVPIAIILLVALVSFLFNHVQVSVAAQGVYVLLRYALVFYLAASSHFTARDARVLVQMLVAGAFLQCLVGATQFALLRLGGFHLFNYEYVEGTIKWSNAFGMYLTLVCVIAIACYSPTWIRRPGLVLALLLGCSVGVMILAASRQSLASLLIGWLVVAVLGWRYLSIRSFHLPLIAITGVAVIGFSALMAVASSSALPSTSQTASRSTPAATSPISTPGTRSPVSQPTKLPQSKPTASAGSNAYDTFIGDKAKKGGLSNLLSTDFYKNSRLYEIANGGHAILQQSPLIGFGPGTFGGEATYHDHAFYDRLNVSLLLSDPHHTFVADVEWMTIFGQIGLIGLLGFLVLFVQIARLAYRAFRGSSQEMTRRLALATIALIPVWFAVGFTGPNFELRPISIWIWLLPGILWSLLRQERQAARKAQALSAAT